MVNKQKKWGVEAHNLNQKVISVSCGIEKSEYTSDTNSSIDDISLGQKS